MTTEKQAEKALEEAERLLAGFNRAVNNTFSEAVLAAAQAKHPEKSIHRYATAAKVLGEDFEPLKKSLQDRFRKGLEARKAAVVVAEQRLAEARGES